MSSFIYNSFFYNVLKSFINLNNDTFKVILVTSSYIPSTDDQKRSDVHGEVSSGNGYIQGGLEVNVNISKNIQNNRVDVTLGEAIWTNSTITASGAIYYKFSTGGARTDDLICFVEFDKEASSVIGGFRVKESTIRVQNPSVQS